MKPLHAHEVLRMMEGHSYSEQSLKEAIAAKFDRERRFYACSAEDMDIGLIGFLRQKGKFKPTDSGVTADISKMCGHDKQ